MCQVNQEKIHLSTVSGPSLETFRFKDENDYEYEIWLKVFSRVLKI